MRANRFAVEVELRQIMFSQMIDQLITGEAFGWIGRLDKKQIKKEKRELFETISSEYLLKVLELGYSIEEIIGYISGIAHGSNQMKDQNNARN